MSEYDGRMKGSKIWVSFGRGVYEITDFVGNHPGGDKILMAAGGALEPFWQLYAVHKTKQVHIKACFSGFDWWKSVRNSFTGL